jgi:hypothetical protein
MRDRRTSLLPHARHRFNVWASTRSSNVLEVSRADPAEIRGGDDTVSPTRMVVGFAWDTGLETLVISGAGASVRCLAGVARGGADGFHASTACPHCEQNLAVAESSAQHVPHTLPMRAPHCSQKLAAGRLSWPHAEHVIEVLPEGAIGTATPVCLD